jgi:molybdopterin synthase catalytic subunit
MHLEYDAHEAIALKMLRGLCEEVAKKYTLVGAAVCHRLGRLEIGEASVVIAVSSAHRGAAFEGCRYIIDTLKTTVPIFKKEYYADGVPACWVGPDGKAVQI